MILKRVLKLFIPGRLRRPDPKAHCDDDVHLRARNDGAPKLSLVRTQKAAWAGGGGGVAALSPARVWSKRTQRKTDIIQLFDEYPELAVRLRRFASAFSTSAVGSASFAEVVRAAAAKAEAEAEEAAEARAVGAETQGVAMVGALAALRVHVDRRFDALSAQLERLIVAQSGSTG
eukprot:SAG11_NODE_1851_length_4167_cov_1.585054_1_plen_175_part_00